MIISTSNEPSHSVSKGIALIVLPEWNYLFLRPVVPSRSVILLLYLFHSINQIPPAFRSPIRPPFQDQSF